MPKLPLLPDIADLACQQRELYPGEQLAGATVDVTSAYNQCPMTTDAAKLTATQIRIPNGARGWIHLIVIYLVCIFGCATAGNVYCQCAIAIDQLHNPKGRKRRSLTYIDDGMIIEPQRLIRKSTQEYIQGVEALFGKEGINLEKVKIWEETGELEGVGWHFDFKTWTVQPKKKGMAKMLLCLFKDIKLEDRTVKEETIDKLTGLLTWYSDGLPLGSKFISSFYALKNKVCPHSKRARITEEAYRDLAWWRALMMVSYTNPRLIAASIDTVRRTQVPNYFMRTDAASLIGGGAYVTRSMGGEPLPQFNGQPIRWTKAELQMFITMGVSINVLEYFVIVYYVMLWGDAFRNGVIHIECDNTSAVSWIMRNRAKNNCAAETLARIFSLFCLSHHITLICTHIKGEANSIADTLSRDLSLAAQDADEELLQDHGADQEPSPPQVLLRGLLLTCMKEQSSMHGQRILRLLTDLHSTHGLPHADY